MCKKTLSLFIFKVMKEFIIGVRKNLISIVLDKTWNGTITVDELNKSLDLDKYLIQTINSLESNV